MTNPYQTPNDTGFQKSSDLDAGVITDVGLVNQVQVLGILMMVQGALEVLYAILMVVMTFFMGPAMQQQLANDPNFKQGNAPFGPEEMSWMFTAIYGGMAVLMLIVSSLHILAGWKVYQFNGRILAFVSFAGGMLTIFGCYCMPTAVALLIYGMIVLLNEPVVRAFSMAKAGASPSEILAAHNRDDSSQDG